MAFYANGPAATKFLSAPERRKWGEIARNRPTLLKCVFLLRNGVV